MKLLVISVYANPGYMYYEYDVQAAIVDADNEEDQEELECVGVHTEKEAEELAKEFSQKYREQADDVWERFCF